MTETWVVVTRYEGGRRPIVHAYGPYTVKAHATSLRKRMLYSDGRLELGKLSVSVCKLWRETDQ